MFAFLSWDALDHLSVLVAAVLALPTVVAAMLAARYAKQTIRDSRLDRQQRQIGDLIVNVARIRAAVASGNYRPNEAEELANVVISLMAALPEVLAKTGDLVKADMLKSDPAIISKLADDALQELQAAMLLTNPDADASASDAVMDVAGGDQCVAGLPVRYGGLERSGVVAVDGLELELGTHGLSVSGAGGSASLSGLLRERVVPPESRL